MVVGGMYAQLYDLTDASNPHKVQEFLSDAIANHDFGATPVISADGTKVSVQQVDPDTGLVQKVVTYGLEKIGDTVSVEEIGHVNTPKSTSHFAMSDAGDWLIVPQYEQDNPINVYSWDIQASSWHLEYSSPAQAISLTGPASEVSVALSNFEQGRIAVSVPPSNGPSDTSDHAGEILIVDADGNQQEIQDRLVRRSSGAVALSQDGQYFASWGTNAGVYDLISQRVCHTFQSATYGDAHTPFALSRSGGWFAEASVSGVTLFKLHASHESCTVSEEAHVPLANTSAVAFGGEHFLVVTGRENNGVDCIGCEVLRVFSIADITSPSAPVPEQRLPTRASVELNGDVKSISMSADGAWLATGGNYAALYNLADAHQVQGFLSSDGHHCQNSASIDSVGVMPVLSADGSIIAVPTCVDDFTEITSVKTYTIDSAGQTTLHGSVQTPNSTTDIAMSDAGDWLVVPQTKEGNPVNLYKFDAHATSWVSEYSSAAQQIALAGPAGKVSVSLSNFETGTLAVGIGPRGVGATSSGEVLLATIGQDPVEIEDLLVRYSIGNVALSKDGRYLASWETHAGVYDILGYFVCHTFQTAAYNELAIPFALSRTGGWFAEATVSGVTLYKIRSTANSCTMTQEAHMPLTKVSVVAFGGEDWLAVTAQSDDEGCLGGCNALRIYNMNDLVVGLEGKQHALEVIEMAV